MPTCPCPSSATSTQLPLYPLLLLLCQKPTSLDSDEMPCSVIFCPAEETIVPVAPEIYQFPTAVSSGRDGWLILVTDWRCGRMHHPKLRMARLPRTRGELARTLAERQLD